MGRPPRPPPPVIIRPDPTTWYQPSPTQLAFHQSWSYYSLIRAGGRGGKTTAALIDLAWCLRGVHPFKPWRGPFIALAFAINRQQSAMVTQMKLLRGLQMPSRLLRQAPAWRLDATRREGHCVIDPAAMSDDDASYVSVTGGPPVDVEGLPLLPDHEIEDVRGHRSAGFFTAYQVIMKNGCELWFAWSDVEDAWMKIQGPKIGYVFLDENCGSRRLLIEAKKRLKDSQTLVDHRVHTPADDWRGRLVWAAHGTDDNEAFDDFARLCEQGENGHEVFDIAPTETGAVSDAANERFAATLTPEERAIHVDGTGSMGDLVRVFRQEWDASRNVAPYDHIIHPDDNIWIGYDPGVDHPTGIVVAVTRSVAPTHLRVVRCWIRKGGTIHDDTRLIAEWLNGRKLAGLVYDAALANKNRGSGPTVLQQFKAAMATANCDPIGWWKSKKGHEPGINLMREMFLAGRIVIDPSPESGGPQLVSQIVRLKGKEETKFTGPGGLIRKNDDGVDSLRYLCMARPQWSLSWRCGKGNLIASDEPQPGQVRYPDEERQFQLSAQAAALRDRRTRRQPRVWGGGSAPPGAW